MCDLQYSLKTPTDVKIWTSRAGFFSMFDSQWDLKKNVSYSLFTVWFFFLFFFWLLFIIFQCTKHAHVKFSERLGTEVILGVISKVMHARAHTQTEERKKEKDRSWTVKNISTWHLQQNYFSQSPARRLCTQEITSAIQPMSRGSSRRQVVLPAVFIFKCCLFVRAFCWKQAVTSLNCISGVISC